MACVSDDAQWLCMVTLFVASVATLLVYFVQYFYGRGGSGHAGPVPEEAGALLNWALSQRSWKSQWRRAWFRTLNERAAETANSVRLIFEEDGLQSSDLVLDQVCSFRKSPGQKAMCCRVVGEKLQFSLSAAQPNSSAEPLRYSVKVSPLHLQLDLQMTEADGDVRLNWGLSGLDSSDLQLVPSFVQGGAAGLSVHAVRDKLRQILCDVRPSVALSSRPAQAAELKEAHSKAPQVSSPPKPPRAHEWKLLVKNIRVTWQQEGSAAGGMNPQCVLQLDDPPQKLTSSVLTGTSTPSWDQPFIFELSGRSKELNIQLMDQGKPQESSLIGQVSVPFDLVKKQPKGQHSFELMTKDEVVGSLTTEFTYLEPSEVRTWQAPTPAVTKRVEMDRTVMPCGTVVTTITAVKSKPGRPLPSGLSETLLKPASKTKLAERRVSEQPSLVGATVSKALSSSDTELLMLNGTDPVAEAAIRQLQQSAKLKMKSPVKKSTIIISGVAKAPLSQDEELALMAGYAASMDASMSGGPEVIQAAPTPPMLEANSMEPLDPLEGPSHGAMMEDWESQHGEDQDMDKTSLSLCISETSSKKGKGSFLHKSAKLFFRRRHQRKDPGMSQSHNDLVYLEHPEQAGLGEREHRTATLRRIINQKLLHKGKSKANGSARQPPA
ncbi:C2 domain-containing protein 2 isoform X2 [Denticeps clupeoides]|uniref:C2 domain-containing protein 2 isoform X2 n=1 Tax=Denticeps clupeoides TaxID=299321 RepID=UPI0010A43E96|nr:C2 domain-containing protein 2 isoform X2 [Denticeps clupeoides]